MLLALLALLALTSPVLWLLQPHRVRHSGWVAALPPAFVFGWLLNQLGSEQTPLVENYLWSPEFGLSLGLRLDGLALLFGLIITGIGVAVAIYAGYYFEEDPQLGYFYGLLFLFMTSMLGLVWADNLLALFVFWEGTSITSYLLIAFKLADKLALEGARRAFLVTSLGALAMLAGMVLLAQMSGSYTISTILAQEWTDHALYPAALVLILLGAFTKSAQFPFHFWLPGAMAAPTPASAYLHSATMVKAGVYLLARLHPALSDSPLWFWSLLIGGGITMVLGAASALRYYDLKAILAYATVSQLGVLVLLLAFPTEKATIAVTVGILAHALYKGPLFLVAGIIDHATGTRDIRRLANLRRALPWVTATAVLAAVSMAGLPPSFGFLSKEVLLETFYGYAEEGQGWIGWIVLGAATLSGALFVAYSLVVLWEPFFRRHAAAEEAHVHHAPSLLFVLPALLLALVGTAIPFVLTQVEGALFAPPVASIAGTPVEVHLQLWHGFTPVLLTSLVAIALGIVIFFVRRFVRQVFTTIPAALDGTTIFDRAVDALYAVAGWSTRTIQGGSLATQVSITLLCAVAFVVYAVLRFNFLGDLRTRWTALPAPQEIVLVVLGVVAAMATVRARGRLSAIISLGVVGVVVTLFFVFFGAPDLALTQLLIEVLTVVLLVLVFYRIPPRTRQPNQLRELRHVVVAVAVGLWGFALVLISVETPFLPSIADYFLLNAVPGGHGGNIVNVILVDFRGFDTMGEISVLAIAAAGGYALLRAARLGPVATVAAAKPSAAGEPHSTPLTGELQPHRVPEKEVQHA
jgi:NADH:ubiquinone oxidoreductase subunit 5 (subunit L)/multisubunit Na+/H+ antiporter MnhA subunit